jgi:hypothetical protein
LKKVNNFRVIVFRRGEFCLFAISFYDATFRFKFFDTTVPNFSNRKKVVIFWGLCLQEVLTIFSMKLRLCATDGLPAVNCSSSSSSSSSSCCYCNCSYCSYSSSYSSS